MRKIHDIELDGYTGPDGKFHATGVSLVENSGNPHTGIFVDDSITLITTEQGGHQPTMEVPESCVPEVASPTLLRHDFLAWVPDDLLRQWKLVVEPERKEIVATVTAEAIDARVGIDRISERIELQLGKIFARVPSLSEAIEHHWKPL
jgi:hypothetical protein